MTEAKERNMKESRYQDARDFEVIIYEDDLKGIIDPFTEDIKKHNIYLPHFIKGIFDAFNIKY